MSEQILFLISAIVFIVYLVFIIAMFGIPASVSDSFYSLNAKKKDLGYLFTLWCYLTGIPAIALMLSQSDGRWFQMFGFFAGGALCFVGTAPLFKDRERRIHSVSAFACAIAALLWIVFSGYWRIPAALLLPAVFALVKWKKQRVFWAEIWIFVSTYLTLAYLL
ncbi:MAG: hypothetical protein LBS88_09730 [Tannerellaceae bacterium]|nr:hypothetical protein [Tannerellaceae bacterium]